VPSLVDTNILVYRVDPRDPARRRRATALLEAGIADRSLVLAHQSIIEFVVATSRPRRGKASLPLLPLAEALGPVNTT
jgi:predicted nucleic acid-binding protein